MNSYRSFAQWQADCEIKSIANKFKRKAKNNLKWIYILTGFTFVKPSGRKKQLKSLWIIHWKYQISTIKRQVKRTGILKKRKQNRNHCYIQSTIMVLDYCLSLTLFKDNRGTREKVTNNQISYKQKLRTITAFEELKKQQLKSWTQAGKSIQGLVTSQ